MIITRKIEVYVNEPDKEIKQEYYDTLYKWRWIVIKAANMLSSHLFIQVLKVDTTLASIHKTENGL